MTHYKSHPSGIEAIEITQYESFLRGNIIKYIMRAPYKGSEYDDLLKAAEYLQWEIERVEEERFLAKFSQPNTKNIREHLEDVEKMKNEWDEEYQDWYYSENYIQPDKCEECSGNCKVC